LLIRAAVTVGVAQANYAKRRILVSRIVDRDEQIAVRRNRDMSGLSRLAVTDEISDDDRAEARR
jgi:hypothetical protein